jgi:hypothetical protein
VGVRLGQRRVELQRFLDRLAFARQSASVMAAWRPFK